MFVTCLKTVTDPAMHKLPDVWDPADAVADDEHRHNDDGDSGQPHLQHRIIPFLHLLPQCNADLTGPTGRVLPWCGLLN